MAADNHSEGTDHSETSLPAALMADPSTARLLAAWRRSVRELQQARAVAIAAGYEDLVHFADEEIHVDVQVQSSDANGDSA